ncbi:MAG: SpoIIE family protein phosphatase [Verrucomicrobia bacterium]|nr:SpoIIE family protein phosphatase [Verrucomicrobiota bacterium]
MRAQREIVVADDEPEMRRLLVRALSRLGFVVTSCVNGEEALKILNERKGKALLVLDYVMPGLNGAQVCQRVRSHPDPAIAQTPIILLTAHAGEEHEIECFRAGADDFVSKPVSLPVLRARIETHLRLAALRAQLREQNRQLEEWRAIREFDMEAAGLVQQAIIPRQMPEIAGWRFALHFQPFIQVGGDSFDGLSLPGGGLLLWIADATGHGVSAALVTVLLKLLFRHAVEETSEPAPVLERVNREFMAIFRGHSFLTAACLRIQPEKGMVRVAGAGHPPVLILRRRGKVEALPSSAPPIGLLLPGSLEERAAKLSEGDTLLLVTDGVYGVSNPRGERFSFEHLVRGLEGATFATPQELIAAVLAQARDFSENGPFDDDVALVAIRRD